MLAPTLFLCDSVCIIALILTRRMRPCAGTRVYVDGLVQVNDRTAEGEELYFARIHPINPNETDWVTGFVREKFLTLVSKYPRTVVKHVQKRLSAEPIPFPPFRTSCEGRRL